MADVDLAPESVFTTNSYYSATYQVTKAVDGVNNTRWVSADRGTGETWIQCDWGVGNTAHIHEIHFVAGTTGDGEHFSEYYLEYWNGASWIEIVHVTSYTDQYTTETTHVGLEIDSQKIRMRMLSGNSTHALYRFEVMGPEINAKIEKDPSQGYYTASDTDHQAALATTTAYLDDDDTSHMIVLGPSDNHAVGFDLGAAKYVNRLRFSHTNTDWANFKVYYNTTNGSSGWTEVSNPIVPYYIDASMGMGGNWGSEIAFDPVNARWWKVWAKDPGATGVMSLLELELYGIQDPLALIVQDSEVATELDNVGLITSSPGTMFLVF